MQKPTAFIGKLFLPLLIIILGFAVSIVFQNCKKTVEPQLQEENQQTAGRKKPKDPPPPPPQPFYFGGCGSQTTVPHLIAGVPANTSFSMSYFNSPGGSYPAFTSATLNGITISAPAGTLNVGSGSVVFTASGTPISSGQWSISMSIGGSISCAIILTATNAPANCGTSVDPGLTAGSTGCVTFTYRGQQVSYTTVRARDGRIWLQQNLGSPQVAWSPYDQASFGDYFQWGRWDDGHQVRNSPVITGGPSLLNPSNIPAGNPNFITGTTTSTKWWGEGGISTDTWSGTVVSSTNGKDPCAALGAGWRLPTAAEWQNVANYEDLFGTLAAYDCNLKLPTTGYRYGGFVYSNGDVGYYWTSDAAANSSAKVFFFNDLYDAGIEISERGQGFSCRCIKD